MPELPSFFADPTAARLLPFRADTGQALSRGRFLDSGDPNVGFLNPLVSLNPEATQQAVGLASRDTIRNQKRVSNDILNELEANNQIESSVTVNRLSELAEEFGRDIADINTRFHLADVERSLNNIGSLFELGTNITGSTAQLGLTNQAQVNEFNLQRFQLELAQEAIDRAGRKSRGGLTGALTGGAGGALAGLALAPFTGGSSLLLAGGGALLGGLAGGLGPEGTGGDFLNAGASGFGLSRRPSTIPQTPGGGFGGTAGRVPTFFPRSSALDSLRISSRDAGLTSGDDLLDRFLLFGNN
jgi:hypothetical protein